ncbi:MAG: flagellin [Sulfuricurvum sp.]|uniref:flagellin n=1 Tax=Sulfuricurvum sp. TaxID=2025608 RepID=UPI00260647EC|nr:flagellin [Sulfuricurvum sp.]MDD2828203.1 flagellin [Sulfuricurvum sp.]MDD4949842.1 flagellin [Sulfuricurvum sp.]
MKIEPSYNTLPQMNIDSSKRDKTLEKIASSVALEIQDSASRSIADSLQNDISMMSQGVMNANDGISMMQIADGTLNFLNDQTQTLNDLSVRYNSASLNESQKQALQSEFNHTVASMQQSISGSSYNGQSLFGSNQTFSLGESSITSSIPSLTPSSLSIVNQDSIQTYRDSLAQAGSDIGSTTNSLVTASNNLLDKMSATSAAKSQLSDTDIAKIISDFQQSNTKLNMAEIAMAHQHDALRQTIGKLLG